MSEINFTSIGIIHTPHKTRENMPIQPLSARGVKATVELNSELVDGLRDLESFSHLILIYHLHKSEGYDLDWMIKPMDCLPQEHREDPMPLEFQQ
ncbi:MAG: TrmO family methyltransferase [Marinifilum sp.]|jgi:tRNA (Thr-GGU) A37 N-methylase|nr:TrmO family methyltransferase [Marinifilum sp.]